MEFDYKIIASIVHTLSRHLRITGNTCDILVPKKTNPACLDCYLYSGEQECKCLGSSSPKFSEFKQYVEKNFPEILI